VTGGNSRVDCLSLEEFQAIPIDSGAIKRPDADGHRIPESVVSQGQTAMKQAPPTTLAEGYDYGRRLRKKAPREKHAELRGPAGRDPVAILAAGDRTRVPELVPVRYERMLVSPFTFLRGAAAVMAADLEHQIAAGIPVQACGDCHLMNFGAFATPEENIVFDINDFDETLPGVDFTVDLKRLAASVAVAALAAKFSKPRAQPWRPTGRGCAPWPSGRRWKSGTARSTSRRKLRKSKAARSGGNSPPSWPRPPGGSRKTTTFRTW
jgi:hypothetical protein